MAHSTLHFSLGMVVGSLMAFPRVGRAWRGACKVAVPYLRWVAWSWAMGVVAVFPGLLRRSGVPDAVCDGWWMNVFLFYPLVNRLKPGALTMGPLVLAFCFGCQYVLLVALIAAVRRRQRRGDITGLDDGREP